MNSFFNLQRKHQRFLQILNTTICHEISIKQNKIMIYINILAEVLLELTYKKIRRHGQLK